MSGEDPNGLKRRRVARACDTCRRKKVRCDGVQPGNDPPSCTNCKAYGYECAFIDAPKKRGPPKGYIEALETRLQRMESILGGLVQSGDLPEGTISSNLEWINVNESNFKSAQESHGPSSSRLRKSSSYDPGNNSKSGKTNPSYPSKNMISSLNNHSQKNGGQSSSDSEDFFSNDSNEYSGSHYDLNDSTGQLAIDESGHTRYLGNSSAIFLLRITKKVANGQVITVPKSIWHTPVKPIGPGTVFELPPKELCDRLLEAYWREVHPYLPFIDKDDLMEKYENLETNYPLIILLYSIFALTAKHVDDPSHPKDNFYSGFHYFAKAKELLKDEFDNATIPIVQSLLLLAIHNQGHKDSVTWVYIGLAIRLAQDMGLHRDSSKWNFDERKSELRRRVWWACVIVDRYTSAGYGRPLAINEVDWDVNFPVAGKIPGDDEEAIEAWVEMIKCNLILGRILNHVYCIKSKSSQGNMESVLGSLDNELNEWRDNLPKHLFYDSTTTATTNDLCTNRKVVLNLMYYTQQILLHRPHIRGPKSKAPPSSIPSLTICTMAANNITHILYRSMKDGGLRFSWPYTFYVFFTAASMHIINALSGDDRFREVAKHGLRMTLKCLEFVSQHWQTVDKVTFIIRDLLKATKIELEGITEGIAETSEHENSQAQKIKNPLKKRQGVPSYVKLEDMAAEGTPRDKNPFLNCLPPVVEHPPPKITFAPSPNQPSSPTDSTDPTNSFSQNQPNHHHHHHHHHQTAYTESIFTAMINHQNTINNSNPLPETDNSQSSITRSSTNDAMQYEQTSSPESTTTSSSSSPGTGFMSFTEYLTTDGGLFPTNADAFNPDVTSLLFDNIDDPMGNNNPFLSLPSVVDWNGWTDWTEYMLRMQGLRNPNSNVGNMTSTAGPSNVVVGNQNMQNAVTTLMSATNIQPNMN